MLTGKGYESGCYVEPVLAEADNHYAIVQEETFAPILYLIRGAGEVENAIANVNIGTSGTKIGGIFGGEKETGTVASRDRMPGKAICAGRPIPSITAPGFPWPRASSLTDKTNSTPLLQRGILS